MNILFLAY